MQIVHHQLPALIARLKNGDQSAFAVLYEVHVEQVYAYVFSILKIRSLTDDVVQDVFFEDMVGFSAFGREQAAKALPVCRGQE